MRCSVYVIWLLYQKKNTAALRKQLCEEWIQFELASVTKWCSPCRRHLILLNSSSLFHCFMPHITRFQVATRNFILTFNVFQIERNLFEFFLLQYDLSLTVLSVQLSPKHQNKLFQICMCMGKKSMHQWIYDSTISTI